MQRTDEIKWWTRVLQRSLFSPGEAAMQRYERLRRNLIERFGYTTFRQMLNNAIDSELELTDKD